MSSDAVIDALAAMELAPRRKRWASLSYCVIDAIWSTANRYDGVVVPLVQRVAERNGDPSPLVDTSKPLPPDPLPLLALLERYPTTEALRHDTNAQRTSTRNGILKADAVLRYADILVKHQVLDLAAATIMIENKQQWDEVDQALAAVPGDGQDGIRRGYLWMLCGSDWMIKPDRMILRWLARHGLDVTPAEARSVLESAAEALTERIGRRVTPRMVDRAIWKAESTRPTLGPVKTIMFDVADWPPIKNEATSLFAARHPQRRRVESLLAAAAAAIAEANWTIVANDIALDITIYSPAPRPPGDATNFLGGIADVLQGRPVSPNLDMTHLGGLRDVALFADDRQIQQIGYRVVQGTGPAYSVQVTIL
ncbi:hypothetical protein [Asanoa iriomotensis]|uniref:Uncharacterized protein n=1 Tax=Asanoa iriomotensis TaxID=234613 RepID=A0ABQ4CAU8_9ACTN|nr:hypothetical protein [Asanoa iriomotensis]GIF59899.1 hypothetical protein Air01nite_59940 [Asanoa iriomotensis]